MSVNCCSSTCLQLCNVLVKPFSTRFYLNFRRTLSEKLRLNKAYRNKKRQKTQNNSISNNSTLAWSNLVIYYSSCFSKGPPTQVCHRKPVLKIFEKFPRKQPQQNKLFVKITEDFLGILETFPVLAIFLYNSKQLFLVSIVGGRLAEYKVSHYGILFLVRIFPYIDWIRWFTETYTFTTYMEQYRPQKIHYSDIFHAVI